VADLTPYSTAKPFFGPLATWLPADDALRIAAYQLYEGIYRNVPESFKLVQRGKDSNPIYVPSAKTIIEAKNRYLAKRWDYSLDPRLGSPADREAVDAALANLFARELVYTKFGTQKRYGLIRGDAVWHVVADPGKPPGRRISVYEVDPASYFPIDDPWNADKVLGCHLATPVVMEDGTSVIKRQTYRKTDTGGITYELSWWEAGAWDDRDGSGQELKPAKVVPPGEWNTPVPETLLPPAITAIPVYHVKNSRVPNAQFGTSELEGFERIIAGVSQGISDEELTLAMQGLGFYWTTSGPPVDAEGKELNWEIGPGYVVEIDPEATWGRANGVGTVTPMQDHVGYLEKAMREAAGVPDIAIGNVDVSTAESGIALAFKMAPILAGNEEKEQELLGKMDQLLHDLVRMWLPTFEQLPGEALAVSIVDDPMPVNRKAVIDEIVALMGTDPPLISAEYARTLLAEKLGYEFADEIGATVVTEAAEYAKARNADPFTARIAQELET
jgi:hypothetical protein